METILLFLAKHIASSTVGHYVGKGLGLIDKKLPELINNEPDIQKIKEYISKNSLDIEVMEFSDKVKSKIENTKTSNIINFTGGTNQGIVANTVQIKTTKKSVTISAPHGTVATSLMHKNYAKYLIDRYHDFKKANVGKDKMKYSIIYNSIKNEFGAKWDMISLENFSKLSTFLQKRIDGTILGKNKKAKKIRRYSTFEEYVSKCSS